MDGLIYYIEDEEDNCLGSPGISAKQGNFMWKCWARRGRRRRRWNGTCHPGAGGLESSGRERGTAVQMDPGAVEGAAGDFSYGERGVRRYCAGL